MGRLDLGFVDARLRFKLRGGFGMARWIQRRSAGRGCHVSGHATTRWMRPTPNEPIGVCPGIIANGFNSLTEGICEHGKEAKWTGTCPLSGLIVILHDCPKTVHIMELPLG